MHHAQHPAWVIWCKFLPFMQEDETRTRSGNQPFGCDRLLVVGHSGFIGRHLIRALARIMPDAEVVGASAPEYDLTKAGCVSALATHVDPRTTVVFLAGLKRQVGDSLETFDANIAIASNFCRCLLKRTACRVIYVSSAAVYGEEHHDLAITEETAIRPTSLYGAGKFASECMITKTLQGIKGSSLTILRPPLVYGPGDATESYGPSGFLSAAVSDKPVYLWGDGTERREFLFVGDLATLIAQLATTRHHGILNAASGTSHSYSDVLRLIGCAVGRHIETMARPRSKPKVDHAFDNAALRRLFPDFPFTPLEVGIRAMLPRVEKRSS